MSGTSIYGTDLQAVQHLATVQQDTITLNTTKLFYPVIMPVGFGNGRIIKISWVASAILAQAGGTTTVTVKAGLVGALRTLVNAQTVLGGVADTPADFTQAAETALKEYTILEGHVVQVTLASSNNALGTNGALGINVHWHSIPKDNKGDDVKHASFYLP